MALTVREQPQIGKYFDTDCSMGQQLVDRIMSQLYDCKNLPADLTVDCDISIISNVILSLNSSLVFNTKYQVTSDEVIINGRTCYRLVFSRLI
jgi:hypothetical protein